MASLLLKRTSKVISCARSLHLTPSVGIRKMLDRIDYNLSQYNKYGLYKDDLLQEYDPDVVEAISRLPEEAQMKRLYRSIRAHQLLIEHNVLPKEQWTSYDDENHHYLQSLLAEVIKERRERENWEKNH